LIIPCFPLFVNKSFYELFNIVFQHKNKSKHKMDGCRLCHLPANTPAKNKGNIHPAQNPL
ncbi:hypothetical protein, partial [Clostridium sp.]|uniref:hypothetical protein n=1 Tax=Clostridium sp. TaxID=1506 RepID=UPI003078ACF5